MAPARNYPMCKNSTRYNRTRNFWLYGHTESKKTQKFVFRSALRPNQISFSHGQDQSRTSTDTGRVSHSAASRGRWHSALRDESCGGMPSRTQNPRLRSLREERQTMRDTSKNRTI